MASYQELFAIGEPFDAFVSRGLPDEMAAVHAAQSLLDAKDALSTALRQRIEAVQGRFHLLAAGEMWCPDCQLNLTAMDHLQRMQPRINVAIISKARAEHALKALLNVDRIAIPLVVILDEQFVPIGRFVEQPQAVVAGGEAVATDYRAGRYLHSTLDDLLTIIEAHEGRKPATA